jgi:uncharacterized ferritin-like protein (DUF455 family)
MAFEVAASRAVVGRMLEERGYDLTDSVVRKGDEREVVTDYLAAHEITVAAERDSPEEVAFAMRGYRAVYQHPVAARASADPVEES